MAETTGERMVALMDSSLAGHWEMTQVAVRVDCWVDWMVEPSAGERVVRWVDRKEQKSVS